MQILGYHIISDEELKRLIDEGRVEQRKMETALVCKLLLNAEAYRRIAESMCRIPIRLTASGIDKLLQKHSQN